MAANEDGPRTPQPANHPASCQVCAGTGWQEGPPILGQNHGRPFLYTTVTPCTHHWSNDDPQPTLLSQDEYLERARSML